MITKVILETDKATKLQRFNEQGMMVGERVVDYEDLIRILVGVAPVAVIIDYLERERLACVKEYMGAITEVESSEEGLIEVLASHLIDHMNEEYYLKLIVQKFNYQLREELTDEQKYLILSQWSSAFSSELVKHQELNLQLFKDVLRKSDESTLKYLFSLLMQQGEQLKVAVPEQFKNIIKAGIVTLPVDEKVALVQEHIGKPKVFMKVLPKADYIVSDGDQTVYLFDIKKQKIRVKFVNVPYENVGHPRILFAIRVDKDGRVLDAKCGAIKGTKPITPETPIYKYPYSNVFSNGSICWNGYRDLPVEQIPNGFLSTANNTHLCENIRELFETYQNKAFNDKTLKRLENEETVYDWC